MKRTSAAGILLGLFVIVLGVLFLGNGIFNWNIHVTFTEFWALIIIAASIVSIVNRGFRFWNVVFLLTGAVIFIGDLGYYIRHPFLVLASAILIVIGIEIIKSAVTGSSHNCRGVADSKKEGYYDDKDYFKYDNSFCEINIKNCSKDLKGGDASISFGRMSVDLSDISISGETVINVSSSFGTMEIIIPRGIPYSTEVTPVFGSFINNAPLCQPTPGAPCLRIKGSAVFGTCTIK
jgi:predicted membrane protein